MRVNSCCCGCTLRGGTIAIGYYFMIAGFVATVLCFTVSSVLDTSDNSTEVNTSMAKGIFIGIGVVTLIQTLSCIVLLYGVYKEKTSFLLPWLAVNMVYLVAAVASVLLLVYMAASSGDTSMITSVAVDCVYVALLAYFLVVVHSYRRSVMEGDSQVNKP